MRARTSRHDADMDLFPFMAVLICTVGALIMLLVVMVQQARVKATAPRNAIARQHIDVALLQQQRQQRLEEHEQRKKLAAGKQLKFDEYKWRAGLLRSSYETTVGQVADQRLALSHLESNTRELSERATAMQAEADLIARTAKQKLNSDNDSKEKINELTKAIASAKQELTKTQEKLKDVDPKYVLIPYAGPNGTGRRPIYIECLQDRVVLQPENVVLIGEDFLAPLTAENPLARALRGKREFLQENGLIGPESEPYPLLVVRPGAAATYAAARSAMKAWESEFGYELVESDVELDYTDADPRLRQLLEDIVIETRGRRRMMRSVRATNRPRRRERLRPSASGGFESVGGGDESFEVNAPDDFEDELPFGTSEPNGYANGGAGGGQGEFDGGSGNGSTGSRAANRFDDEGRQTDVNSSDSYGKDHQFTGQRGDGTGSGNGGGRGTSKGTGQFGEQIGVAGDQPNGSKNLDAFAATENHRFGEEGGRNASASRNERGHPFRNGPGATSETSAGASDTPGFGGSSAEATGSGGKGATGSGGSSTPSAQGDAASSGAQFGNSAPSLAESRGSGWATANLQHDAVGIQRPIYVVCARESISLIPERGTTQELQVFRHRGSINSVVDTFVDSVQTRLDSWGIAGQGIYWKPVLQIRVNRDAEAAYQQLMHLLDDSGIEVTREP